MNVKKEVWIQVDIIPKGKNFELNDEILLQIYKEFLSVPNKKISSWHFFREPQLRFRIEFDNKESRKALWDELNKFIDNLTIVESHYLADNKKKVKQLEDCYKGESDSFKRLWLFQKKLWEWGSKMAVESIKEFKETGANNPLREYQLERLFHLLYNQLNADSNRFSLNEVEMYQRCANNRMLVWSYMNSKQLDRDLLKKIKKE